MSRVPPDRTGPDDPRLAAALEQLRLAGGRVTRARRAVLGTLLAEPGHLSAEDLAKRVRERHPEVHLSTVYRTLDAFERLGVLTHVHLGHGRAIYHLAGGVSHHAVCESCGGVLHLPADLLDEVRERIEATWGFAADTRHFALVGRCAACRT